MKVFRKLSYGLVFALAMLYQPAQGQAQEDQFRALVDELNALIERGEKERLADPWFLRDLRAVVSRYDWPWQRQILSDDFSGQGPQPGPPWQVTAGEFLIDWRHGLRSVVEAQPKQQAQETQQSGEQSDKDVAKELIGSLLQQAIGSQQQGETQQAETQAAATDPGYAVVIAPVKITNAFAIQLQMTSRPIQGGGEQRLEFGPYQGAAANTGYRLVYTPGQAGQPSLQLVKLTSRGTTSTLELYDKPLDLADDKVHEVLWTRDRNGFMVVSLDGQELFQLTDRSFSDPFDGFAIVNAGGDYAFRSVTIDGTS